MSTVSLTGEDTIIINNRVMADLGDGDAGAMTFPNEIATLKTGKNGNVIYSLNQTGKEAELVLRVIRGSADDKFLNNLMSQQRINFSSFILMSGEFIKKVGDGEGNVTSDTYIMNGGIFMKEVDTKSNQEGDTEQSISIYSLKFSNAPRAIG